MVQKYEESDILDTGCGRREERKSLSNNFPLIDKKMDLNGDTSWEKKGNLFSWHWAVVDTIHQP